MRLIESAPGFGDEPKSPVFSTHIRHRIFVILNLFRNFLNYMVARPRIELGTQGFSVLCSTD